MWKRGCVLALVAGLAACTEPSDAPDGKRVYDTHCIACHGVGGEGDGRLASELAIPPANLTALSRKNGGTFPVEDVMAQVYGYPGRYHQGLMPEFGPQLAGNTVDWTSPSGEVIPTPAALLALVQYLEGLQR